MTPDLSLLLAHYASDRSTCSLDGGSAAVLSPEAARIAAQVAHLTGEERRLLALGDEVREVALALGQQRFEVWSRENPEAVASCRATVGQRDKDVLYRAAPAPTALETRDATIRLS